VRDVVQVSRGVECGWQGDRREDRSGEDRILPPRPGLVGIWAPTHSSRCRLRSCAAPRLNSQPAIGDAYFRGARNSAEDSGPGPQCPGTSFFRRWGDSGYASVMISRGWFVAGWLGFAILARAAAAEIAAPLKLWPGTPPDAQPAKGAEADLTKPTENRIAGRTLIRLGNVSDPTLTVYRPPGGATNAPAVLVFPGGGYHILAWDLEGTEVCEWLNSLGATAVLVKYRVPRADKLPAHTLARHDGQRAVGLVRQHAREWGIDPARIGVLGFSAGAHLAASLGAEAAPARSYPRVDAADDLDARPNFSVLIYPGGLVTREDRARLNPEVVPGTNTPPTFIVMAQDDPVWPENAVSYAAALQAARVPLELHVYSAGGHGYGLRRTELPVTKWPDLLADWMRSRGILKP
jgi:acetyl esterase/lipase